MNGEIILSDTDKDMNEYWNDMIRAIFMDIAFGGLSTVRPTDIALGCEIDTEIIDDVYAKSEYIKEYDSNDTTDIEGGILIDM